MALSNGKLIKEATVPEKKLARNQLTLGLFGIAYVSLSSTSAYVVNMPRAMALDLNMVGSEPLHIPVMPSDEIIRFEASRKLL